MDQSNLQHTIPPRKIHCDGCGCNDARLKRKRGMALCPECIELAKDYFGR